MSIARRRKVTYKIQPVLDVRERERETREKIKREEDIETFGR